jgi:hypothetical protein
VTAARQLAPAHPGHCSGPGACLNPSCLPAPTPALRLFAGDAAVQRANEARANVIAEARVWARSLGAPPSLEEALQAYDVALAEARR